MDGNSGEFLFQRMDDIQRFFSSFSNEKTNIITRINSLTQQKENKTFVEAEYKAIQESIKELEKSLQTASVYLPNYDKRQYIEALRELGDSMKTLREKVLPRPKFSFKTSGPSVKREQNVEKPAVEETKTKAIDSNEIDISNQKDASIVKSGIKDFDICVSNMENCSIELPETLTALRLTNLVKCVVKSGVKTRILFNAAGIRVFICRRLYRL
jgi:hypothetical protein